MALSLGVGPPSTMTGSGASKDAQSPLRRGSGRPPQASRAGETKGQQQPTPLNLPPPTSHLGKVSTQLSPAGDNEGHLAQAREASGGRRGVDPPSTAKTQAHPP